jgi:GntR family transcriptional regulator/MocR family aminotransferase
LPWNRAVRRISTGFLPPIALEPEGSTPVYMQLADWFRHAIVQGRLRPGQRLPSTRGLARELNLSRMPVQGAYEQLHTEGYFETFVGAGTCVAKAIPDESLRPGPELTRTDRPTAAAPEAPRSVSRRAGLLRRKPQTWLLNLGAFRVGLPALDHFPVASWARLMKRHLRRPPGDSMAYGYSMGYLPFREAIAEYLSVARGVRCDASQILVTSGSQEGLALCAQVLLDAGDRVWMEEPGYPGAHQALTAAGARLLPVPVDEEGLSVGDGIRRGSTARVAYVTPSHQFPLGVTLSASRRMSLLNWAVRSGTWIIEDDNDSEYRFGAPPIASLQGLDSDSRVIYVGTFSKLMFPAMRLGYLVLPRDLVAPFGEIRGAGDAFSSTLYQLVMNDFIREGHLARHIRKMRVLYRERRAMLVEAIHRSLGDRLEVVGDEAGLQLTALLHAGVSDLEVTQRAARRGISVRPLSACYLKAPERGGVILGYGNVGTEAIQAGVLKLGETLREIESEVPRTARGRAHR